MVDIEKTRVESFAGSLWTKVGGTVIAAASGNILAALLPVLSDSLAARLSAERVEAAIRSISTELETLRDKVKEMTDSQYLLVNESTSAMLSTIDVRKLEFLKQSVRNAVLKDAWTTQQAVVLGRMLRQISTDEALFLIEHVDTPRVWFNEVQPGEHATMPLHVAPSTPQGLIVSGLLGLGLLVPAEPTWDESGMHRWAPISSLLRDLLIED